MLQSSSLKLLIDALERITDMFEKAGSSAILCVPLKHLPQWHAKDMGDPESSLQRRRIFSGLNRSNRLPRYPDTLTELGLRHFTLLETKGTNPIRHHSFHHACLR
jgi:hypothetical protein